jgi:uncharacterized glyoxalase superfamily protein PhnB
MDPRGPGMSACGWTSRRPSALSALIGQVMLGHCPDALLPSATGDHSYFAYLHVDDAQALHDEWVGRGAIVIHPPIDRDWGMREFAVTTPDGHRLMVGQVLPSD